MSAPAENAAERLDIISTRIAKAVARFDPGARKVQLVAVSKTFSADDVRPLLLAGQRVFGENRVQEAQAKWPGLRQDYPDTELHLIGPLQTNKVKDAVKLFDVIESVDREKLAAALAKEMRAQGRHLACFVQVNIGAEPQKAGVSIANAPAFVARCQSDFGLDIVGLMGIPPADQMPGPYFAQLAQLSREAGLAQISMGMSGDFETAIAMGATQVRIGSALFGTRAKH